MPAPTIRILREDDFRAINNYSDSQNGYYDDEILPEIHKYHYKGEACDSCATRMNRITSVIKTRKNCILCKQNTLVGFLHQIIPEEKPKPQRNETIQNNCDDRVCPHCSEVIDRVNYQSEQTEFGTCTTTGDDWNSSDVEGTGDTNYYCPECEEQIYDLDELEEPNEEGGEDE